MSLSQNTIIRALDSYTFSNIWNAPVDECGVNLQLYLASSRFVTNSLITNTRQTSLSLPSFGDQYAVFWVNYVSFEESLIISPKTWISTDTLGNEYQTLFHVYSETGLMLPKSTVFIYHDISSNMVYIAIKKNPLILIVGMTNWTKLYLSVYRYAKESGTPLNILSQYISSTDLRDAIGPAWATARSETYNSQGSFIYINGYDCSSMTGIGVSVGQYIDIYTDQTVINAYTVQFNTSSPTGYYSELYQTYKEILHCPKQANPSNLIITPEMVSITAQRNSDQLGCFVHHNKKNGITQITHCDFGIDTDIVNAYRETLVPDGTLSDITFHVRIRSHNNQLIREANYIKYLYLCSDTEIKKFLMGTGDPTLPFWSASNLEKSLYVMKMTQGYYPVLSQTLADYINSLGYYTTIAAICQYNKEYTIDKLPVNAVSIKKPLILTGTSVYPLVYLNGQKLRDTQVDYVNTIHDKILLSLTPDVYCQIGQTLTVKLVETGSSIPYLFTPSTNSNSITVPFKEVLIYKINTLASPIKGYNTSSLYSYSTISIDQNADFTTTLSNNNTTTIIFNSTVYGNTYLIQNAQFSRCYGGDITTQVNNLLPITLTLSTLCNDGITYAPLLGYNTLEVYLNGRRLIQGIDYSANPLTDSHGNSAIVQLFMCNRSLLSLNGGNYLEVIAHTAIEAEKTIGYVTNNTIDISNNVETWYAGLSDCFTNGYLLIDPIDGGDMITPRASIGNGTPYQINATLPSFLMSVFNNVSSVNDDTKIQVINNYMNKKPPINDTSSLIIPTSWQVYSPYLTAIFNDVVNNTIVLNNDPDNILFLQQFMAYAYLLQNDPTLTATISNVDLRYCDIYPTYNIIHVQNLQNYTILRRLANLLLPTDNNTLGDVLND